MKDTLFFRRSLKVDQKEDYYNLNLYHTINKDNNNVVELANQKSNSRIISGF
jgi:hypothetical protein